MKQCVSVAGQGPSLELAKPIDVHANQIRQLRDQLVEGAQGGINRLQNAPGLFKQSGTPQPRWFMSAHGAVSQRGLTRHAMQGCNVMSSIPDCLMMRRHRNTRSGTRNRAAFTTTCLRPKKMVSALLDMPAGWAVTRNIAAVNIEIAVPEGSFWQLSMISATMSVVWTMNSTSP